jgi:CubicO group peptidase (beta-lactamase class C family)
MRQLFGRDSGRDPGAPEIRISQCQHAYHHHNPSSRAGDPDDSGGPARDVPVRRRRCLNGGRPRPSRAPESSRGPDADERRVSTDVLGRVVEAVSGLSLDRYISERITKPLRMHDTAFWVEQPDKQSPFRARRAWRVSDGSGGPRSSAFQKVSRPVVAVHHL